MIDWLNQLPIFLLIFVRVSCFFITVPIFMTRSIPAVYKIGLSFFLAVLAAIPYSGAMIQVFSSDYIFLVIKEALVGLALGFAGSILFYAIQVAGAFIDLQAGFAMGAVFDPQSGTNMNLTGRLKNIIATLLFLSLDGHHLLIQGVMESYQWIGVEAFVPAFTDGRISTFLFDTFKNSFVIAFIMAAPIMFTLFLVDLVLGIIGKTSPQINLLVVGFPLKMGIHFIMFFLVLPSFFLVLHSLYSDMFEAMSNMIRIMGAA